MVIGDGAYRLSTGTSMAAPFVTGMAALYKQSYPTLNSTEILSRNGKICIGFRRKGKDSEYGYGFVQPPPNLRRQYFSRCT